MEMLVRLLTSVAVIGGPNDAGTAVSGTEAAITAPALRPNNPRLEKLIAAHLAATLAGSGERQIAPKVHRAQQGAVGLK